MRGRPPSTTLDFGELHARYFADVCGFIARRIGDRDLAEELAQETFLRAYRSRDRFDTSRPVWPWLSQIAHNLAVNALRDESKRREAFRGGREDELARRPERDPCVDPVERYENLHRRTVIRSALNELSPRSRRMLLERCAAERTYEEIAAAEGLSNDAVKATLRRARQRFRVAFSAAWDENLAVLLWPLRRLTAAARRHASRANDAVMYLQASAPGLTPLMASGVFVATLAGVLTFGGSGYTPVRATPSVVRPSVSVAASAWRAKPLVGRARPRDGADPIVLGSDAPFRTTIAKNGSRDERTIRIHQREPDGHGSDAGLQVPCQPSPAICTTIDTAFGRVP